MKQKNVEVYYGTEGRTRLYTMRHEGAVRDKKELYLQFFTGSRSLIKSQQKSCGYTIRQKH